MKRRSAQLAVVSIFVLVTGDWLVGAGLSRLSEDILTGERSGGQARLAIERRHAQIIAFGSSRTRRHIAPVVLERRLSRSAHNAGCDGQGIAYARAVQSLVHRRGGRPELVLLDLNPADLWIDSRARTHVLAPWFGATPAVDDALGASDPLVAATLASRAYRFNSSALPIIRRSWVSEPPSDGFAPLPRALVTTSAEVTEASLPFESEAFGLYEAFVLDAQHHGSVVVFFISPVAGPMNARERAGLARLEALSARLDVTVVDFSSRVHPAFSEAASFHDRVHLAENGALRLTELLAETLTDILPPAHAGLRGAEPERPSS